MANVIFCTFLALTSSSFSLYVDSFTLPHTKPIISLDGGAKVLEVRGKQVANVQIPSTIVCTGSENISWIENEDAELDQEFEFIHGIYRTSLKVHQPSDTGWYSCCSLKKDSCSSLYVFATDNEQLLVQEDGLGIIFMHLVQSAKATIPCQPTSSGVSVELISRTSGRSITESTNFGVKFDPFEGFIVEKPVWDMEWSDLVCRAQLGNREAEVAVKIFWSPAPRYPLKPTLLSNFPRPTVNHKIELNCSVNIESGVPVNFKWNYPEAIETHRINVSRVEREFASTTQVTSLLKIEQIRLSDTGLYRCIVSTPSNSEMQSVEIQVTVFNATEVVMLEKNLIYKVGSQVEIHVPLNHSLIPSQYSWTKDGSVVNNSRFTIDFGDRFFSIRIPDVQTTDSGSYTLSLDMDGYSSQFIFHLVVDDPSTHFLASVISVILFSILFTAVACTFKSRKSYKLSEESLINSKWSAQEFSKKISIPERLIIKSEEISFQGTELGSGAFGSVSKALLNVTSNQVVAVAVKRCKNEDSEREKKALVDELNLMSRLDPHPHIVNLIGAVLDPQLMIVVEFCQLGSLKEFLVKNRNNFTGTKVSNPKKSVTFKGAFQVNPNYEIIEDLQPLYTGDLIEYAQQVAKGMEFLASKKIIHRDLAARNVLLVNRHLVKICDFGLSKNCYNYDDVIYLKRISSPLPVKWMAIESIVDKIFTTKSDVWSFGVLLWELFSLGADPYPGQEVDLSFVEHLSQGTRLKAPIATPDHVAHLMYSCWQSAPEVRPNFDQISLLLLQQQENQA